MEYTCYLSGPIESVKDSGVSWRRIFSKMIKKEKITIQIIDPTNKKGKIAFEIGNEREKIQQLKLQNKFSEVKSIMKKIRRWDLRAVDKSDLIVAYIDKNIPSCGTWDEIVTGERQQKPILVIAEGGKTSIPDWAFAIFEEEYIFDTIEDCVYFLKKACNGDVELDDKWVSIL